MPTALRGEPVATAVRDDVADRVRALRDGGTVPTLGTVLASDAAGAARFMDLKHEACADLGIATRDRRLGGHASESAVVEAVDALSEDPEIDAVFVQTPLPIGVEHGAVGRRVDPAKDVDCFHPANLGRLVAADPRFVPATTAAVCRLLAHYDVRVAGAHVVVVGRSRAIGRPLASRLLWDAEPGNATVTVCHSRTRDLAAQTRRADVLVTAAGEPGLVEGSMLTPGTVVVDVSANRRPSGPDPTDRDAAAAGEDGATDSTVVGDVDAESARERVAAITPVPGGVGPVTLATLVDSVATAAERRADGTAGALSENGR
ncbi:MAG: bifunctional 5,10-methylenetetrahydrofolate dehydrogenase/5,10-methenyltetrahydrofolate cyclohydrolase [Haloarculaceae archaeon]